MDFLQNLSAQRRQLLLAGLAALVITAILATVYLVWLRSPYKVLFAELRPTEAATILADLDKRKVPYRLQDEGRTILVPAKVADATRLSVASEDLPLKGTVGFELFNKSDMGLTEFAQQINYRRALQGELARTVMTLQGVESARVHLSLSEAAVFREDRRPPKASVTIVSRAGHTLPAGVVRGIQELVAAAVPDLDVAHVVILDGQGDVISEAPAELSPVAAPGSAASLYADAVRLAVRQYLHDQPVDVQVRVPPGAELPPVLYGETLPRRDFPIRVQVQVQGGLTPSERSQVQQIVIQAAGLDPSLGDSLEVEARGAPPVVSPPVVASTAPDPEPRPLGAPSQAVSLGLAAVLLVMLLTAWRLHRSQPRVRRLTTAQKDAYAARLQRLLTEEGDHAPADL